MLLYLAAAGVGTHRRHRRRYRSISPTCSARSSMSRTSLGRPKVESAAATMLPRHQSRCRRSDPCGRAHRRQCGRRSSAATISSPTAATISPPAILLNDACYLAGKPLVSAALLRFDAQLSVFKAHLGPPHPCYRCLFPEPPPDDLCRAASRRASSARSPAAWLAAGDRGAEGNAGHGREPLGASADI